MRGHTISSAIICEVDAGHYEHTNLTVSWQCRPTVVWLW